MIVSPKLTAAIQAADAQEDGTLSPKAVPRRKKKTRKDTMVLTADCLKTINVGDDSDKDSDGSAGTGTSSVSRWARRRGSRGEISFAEALSTGSAQTPKQRATPAKRSGARARTASVPAGVGGGRSRGQP